MSSTDPSYQAEGTGLEGLRQNLDGGDPSAARKGLAVAVARDPTDEEAWYLLGVADYRLGRFREAVEEFREAVQLDPSDHRAHHGLGRALSQLGHDDEAAQALKIAHALNPDQSPAPDHDPAHRHQSAPPPVEDRPPSVPRDHGPTRVPGRAEPKPLIKMIGFWRRLTNNYDVGLEGVASQVEMRADPTPGLTPPQLYVLNFALRTTDRQADDFPIVAVEMTGAEIRGRLHEGDQVRVKGRVDPKYNLVRAESLTKTATGEVVRLLGRPHRSFGSIFKLIFGQILPWIVFLGVVGGLIALVITGMN